MVKKRYLPRSCKKVRYHVNSVINDKIGVRPALYFKTPEGLIHEWKVWSNNNDVGVLSGFIGQPRTIEWPKLGSLTTKQLADALWKNKIKAGYTHNLESLLANDVAPLMNYDKLSTPRRKCKIQITPYIQPLKSWLRIGIAVKYGRIYMFNHTSMRPLFCNKIEKLLSQYFSNKDWVLLDCEIVVADYNNADTLKTLRSHNKDYTNIPVKLCINDYFNFYKSELRFFQRYAIMEEMVNSLRLLPDGDSLILGEVTQREIDIEWFCQYNDVAIKTKNSVYKPGAYSQRVLKWTKPTYYWWEIKSYEIARNKDKLGVRWECIDHEGNIRYLDPRSARNYKPELIDTAKQYIGKKIKVAKSKKKCYSLGEFKD